MDATMIGEYGGYAVAGIVAAVFAVKGLYTKFVGEGLKLVTTESMGDMVNLLAGQIRELSEANVQLRSDIRDLRDSNIQLLKQNLDLQEQVAKLTSTLHSLSPN